MAPASADGLISGLSGDRTVYPMLYDIASEQVLLTRLPVERQNEAAFLDQRILTPSTEAAWCAWSTFAAAAQALDVRAPAYIFHIGHCGSTLLSRLIAAATGVPALREPTPLRAFANDAAEAFTGSALLSLAERRKRLALFERVWARCGGAVVKATSICNALIEDVSADAPAAFIHLQPETYVAALLGGANSHIDLRNFGQMRMRRLRQLWGGAGDLSALRAGELAAMSWLTEVIPAANSPRRIFTVDFDRFLAEPAPLLKDLCEHLCGGPVSEKAVRGALASGVMGRYSKAPEQAYDASLRALHLAEDRAAHAGEIRAGMAWLEAAAKAFSGADAAFARFGPAATAPRLE